jgi:CheY-like chemotaxis protein
MVAERWQVAEVALAAPVLVVDPDAGQRRFLGALLRQAGFLAEAVPSGEQALEAAGLRRPQLVVLEVRLGDISGYEVCRALREEFGDTIGIESASLVQRPTTRTPIDEQQAGALTLVDALEEHDDVQGVHANLDAGAETANALPPSSGPRVSSARVINSSAKPLRQWGSLPDTSRPSFQ